MGTPILSNWILGLLGLIVLSAVFVLVAAVLSAWKDQHSPGWRCYRRDFFLSVWWQWQYGPSGIIRDLRPFCPSCDEEIEIDYDGTLRQLSLQCKTCSRRFGPFETSSGSLKRVITRFIDQKLRDGSWPVAADEPSSSRHLTSGRV